MGPAPPARGHAGHFDDRVVRARRARSQRTHHRGMDPRTQRGPGDRQRVRHARPAGIPQRADREQSGPAQCDRAQLVDGQRRTAARSVDCRRRHRRHQRRLVLRHRRRQLSRRHRGADRDADRAAAGAVRHPSRGATTVRGRLAVRVRLPADPLDHPAAGAGQPGRRAVLGADADLCRDRVPRRTAHAGISDGRIRLRRARRARCGWRRGDR